MPPKVSLLRKKTKKQSLLRSNPSDVDDESDGLVLDNDFQVGYRRPNIVGKPILIDDELSDYVLDRLRQARMLALKKYHEVWG
jgi:hypothetical protein